METEKKDKGINMDEAKITIQVPRDVIVKVRHGEINHIFLDINEHNQSSILENVNGHLILDVDEMPITYHGCYLYNHGVFPYVIKKTLRYLMLSDGEESCLTQILETDTKPGTRFCFQGPGKSSVEDPNGDSCIWEVSFSVVPMSAKPKIFLMRWNPAISSFTERDYEECYESMKNGVFHLDWSIREWEEARMGDMFLMMRVGDEKAGIVFGGHFLTDPYPDEDWAGSQKRRMYVVMVCRNPVKPNAIPSLSLDVLSQAIPDIEWSHGRSGTLLPDDVAAKLLELWNQE